MAGNRGAADTLGQLIIENLRENGGGSAFCQALEFAAEANGGLNIPINIARERFCDPPPPPPPPSTDFFNAGGVPCRDYRVIFETGAPGSPGTPSEVIKPGPIGSITNIVNNPDGSVNKQIILTSGDGINCPRNFDTMAGTSDARFVDVFARIISVEPVTPDPATEIPIFIPIVQPPDPTQPPFAVDFDVTIDGVDINVPLFFAPPIITNVGVSIPFTFAPTANFNPQIDVTLGGNPQFALDIDLEFIIPLGGDPDYPTPLPGVDPVPLPPVRDPVASECEEFDYERIEDFITNSRCCKPITDVVNVGTFTFEGLNDVANFNVPNNTVACFIGILPGENARVYKFAGSNTEYGHGNASLLVRGNALGFERLFLNNHVLFFPEESDTKGIRISCGKGTVVTINAGIYVPIVEE